MKPHHPPLRSPAFRPALQLATLAVLSALGQAAGAADPNSGISDDTRERALASVAQLDPAAVAAPRVRHAKPAKPALQYLPTQPLTITAGEIMMLPIKGKIVRLALGSGAIVSTTTVDDNLLLIA